MLKKTVLLASALASLAIAVPQSVAQSQGSYWSFDGRSAYGSYQACEDARRTRTLGGAALGGALGAGAGAMAGGDDTRNAVVGAVVGGVAGGIIGREQVKCTQYAQNTRYPNAQTNYRHDGYVTSTSNAYYGGSTYGGTQYGSAPYQTSSNGYYSTQPVRSYQTTQPTRYVGNSGYVTTRPGYTTTQPVRTYSNSGYGSYGYQTTQPTRVYTTTTTSSGYYQTQPRYQSQPTYSHGSTGYTSYPATTYHQPRPASTTYWSYDGRTQYSSWEECQRASRNRTLSSGALGAVAGAGLGTAAGGDDGRNAVIGAIAGGALGAFAGNRSIQCQQYTTNYRR